VRHIVREMCEGYMAIWFVSLLTTLYSFRKDLTLLLDALIECTWLEVIAPPSYCVRRDYARCADPEQRRPSAKARKRAERERIQAARKAYCAEMKERIERQKPPACSDRPRRKRRREWVLHELEMSHEQWRDGVLAAIDEIDEQAVRKGAEAELRALYLTAGQQRQNPTRRR
jgi:hypothetical protein